MEKSSQDLGELEKLLAISPMVIGLREVMHNFRTKRMTSASSWILAGTTAFIYMILTDPKKMIETYGHWPTKVSMVLFGVSFFYGLMNTLTGSLGAALDESDTFKSFLKTNYELGETLKGEKKDEIQADSKPSLEESIGKDLFNTIKFYLKGTKSFWFQTLSFLAGVFLLLGVFFLRVR